MPDVKTIDHFTGKDYGFLSWEYDGRPSLFPVLDTKKNQHTPTFNHAHSFPTVKSAFDYAQQLHKELHSNNDGRLGQIVQNWEDIRDVIMLQLLRQKFEPTEAPWLAWKLIYTGISPLHYGNTIGEKYWGCDRNNLQDGENKLGKLLMEVRDEIWDITQIVSPRKMGLPMRIGDVKT